MLSLSICHQLFSLFCVWMTCDTDVLVVVLRTELFSTVVAISYRNRRIFKPKDIGNPCIVNLSPTGLSVFCVLLTCGTDVLVVVLVAELFFHNRIQSKTSYLFEKSKFTHIYKRAHIITLL